MVIGLQGGRYTGSGGKPPLKMGFQSPGTASDEAAAPGVPEFCSQHGLDSGREGGVDLAGSDVDGAVGTMGKLELSTEQLWACRAPQGPGQLREPHWP